MPPCLLEGVRCEVPLRPGPGQPVRLHSRYAHHEKDEQCFGSSLAIMQGCDGLIAKPKIKRYTAASRRCFESTKYEYGRGSMLSGVGSMPVDGESVPNAFGAGNAGQRGRLRHGRTENRSLYQKGYHLRSIHCHEYLLRSLVRTMQTQSERDVLPSFVVRKDLGGWLQCLARAGGGGAGTASMCGT